MDKKINDFVSKLVDTYRADSGINFIDVSNLPLRDKILEVLELLIEALFPGYTGKRPITLANVTLTIGDMLCLARDILVEQVERAYRHACRMKKCPGCDCRTMAESVVEHLLVQLPHIRKMLQTDIEAAYDGDPAAKSLEEIVLSYPCLTAIATHRIAHELYLKEVPLVPRIMSEYAHRMTGIDIHPGATIGERFFIDHGTGVVIGETAVIGNNVKIYQGVTLGALSFKKDQQGRIVKGGKRHPTIEDDVVIYAEATILGDIVIGKGAVIGGNAWIKESVPAGVTVTMASPELVYREIKKKKQ